MVPLSGRRKKNVDHHLPARLLAAPNGADSDRTGPIGISLCWSTGPGGGHWHLARLPPAGLGVLSLSVACRAWSTRNDHTVCCAGCKSAGSRRHRSHLTMSWVRIDDHDWVATSCELFSKYYAYRARSVRPSIMPRGRRSTARAAKHREGGEAPRGCHAALGMPWIAAGGGC